MNRIAFRLLSDNSRITNDRSHLFASLFEVILSELSGIDRVKYAGNEWHAAVWAVSKNSDGSETVSFTGPCAGLIFDTSITKKETSVCLENFPVPAIKANVGDIIKKLKKNTLVHLDGGTGSIVGTPALADFSPVLPDNYIAA